MHQQHPQSGLAVRHGTASAAAGDRLHQGNLPGYVEGQKVAEWVGLGLRTAPACLPV